MWKISVCNYVYNFKVYLMVKKWYEGSVFELHQSSLVEENVNFFANILWTENSSVLN